MTSPEFGQCSNNYVKLVTELVNQKTVNADLVRSTALCRTKVGKAISNSPEELETPLLAAVEAADCQLRRIASRLADEISAKSFQSWRDLMQPGETEWWWWLDRIASQNPSPLWSIGAGFAITLSLAFLTIVMARFFEGGPDLVGAIAVVFQSVLTLLAGSAVLDFGRERIDKLLDLLAIRRSRRQLWSLCLALLVLVLAIGLRISLPLFSRLYNCAGLRQQEHRHTSEAIASYQRAIALNPDSSKAYYNLATAYEDVEDYDKAVSAYHSAISVDSGMVPEEATRVVLAAYNNLGRLLIIQKQKYSAALRLLAKAEALNPTDQHSRFSIAKNKGWANFGLQNYDEAVFDLKSATALDSGPSSPHCLLALVYEAKKDPAAPAEWCKCMSGRINDAEPEWLEKASDRSAQLPCVKVIH